MAYEFALAGPLHDPLFGWAASRNVDREHRRRKRVPAERIHLPGTDWQNALLRYVRRVLVDEEKRSFHGALKMDKWDELTSRIQQAILAQEPDAAASAAFQVVCEFGRTLEQMGADLDRIATALEMREITISGDDDHGIPAELRHDEPELEHDL